MTSTASLASENKNKQHELHILSDFPGFRNLYGLNDLDSLNNLGGLIELSSLKSWKK